MQTTQSAKRNTAIKGSKAYSSGSFWKIKPVDLIADVILIGISVFFSNSISDYASHLTQENDSWLQVLLNTAAFTLPWYLGYLYGNYLVFYNTLIRYVVGLSAGMIFFMFYVNALSFVSGLPKIGYYDSGHTLFVFILVFAVLASPFMAISGKVAAKARFIEVKENEKVGSYLKIVLVCLSLVFAFVMFGFFLNWWGNTWGLIGFIVSIILVSSIGYFIYKTLRKTDLAGLFNLIGVRVFPLIVLLSITIWSFISFNSTDNLGNPYPHTLSWFILNGYIPLRIIQLFNPPLSIVSFGLAIISTIIFLVMIN